MAGTRGRSQSNGGKNLCTQSLASRKENTHVWIVRAAIQENMTICIVFFRTALYQPLNRSCNTKKISCMQKLSCRFCFLLFLVLNVCWFFYCAPFCFSLCTPFRLTYFRWAATKVYSINKSEERNCPFKTHVIVFISFFSASGRARFSTLRKSDVFALMRVWM